MKKKIYLSVLTLGAILLTSSNSTLAATTLPSGAVPVQKSGIVFGSTAYDYSQSNIERSKNGQIGINISAYASNGDFAPEITGTPFVAGLGYPANEVFTILGADGNVVKKTALAATAQASMSVTGTPTRGFVGVYGVTSDSSNNFYVYGTVTGSTTQRVGFVTKISSTGTILWEKAYGILANPESTSKTSIFRAGFDADGNLIIVGQTNESETTEFTQKGKGLTDIFVAKVNKDNGEYIVKPKTFGGSEDEAFSVSGRSVYQGKLVTDSSGNFYIDFHSNSPKSGDIKTASKGGYDIVYFKFDKNLNLVNQGRVGGSGDDKTNGFIETTTGTLVATVDSKSTDLPASVINKHAGADVTVIEVDKNFKLIGGIKLGGTGTAFSLSRMSGLQISPSGDIVVAGTTWDTTGDFADSGLTNDQRIGYALNIDPTTYELKNKFYYGSEVYGFVYLPTEGNFYTLASSGNNNNNKLGTITGEFKNPSNDSKFDSGFDIVYSKFGPTANTPSFLNAKEVANVLVGDTVDVKKVLNVSIGDYDEFVDQSSITVNPTAVSTASVKSYKVTASATGVTAKTGYINVTANENPVVSGKQLIDATDTLRVMAGTDLTSAKFIKDAKVSAWNIDTNAKYTTTIDATDLAAVNAATTGTLPVKVTIPATAGGVITKTVQVKVMSKEEIIAEIKAVAEEKWGPDQTEYANLAGQAITAGITTPDEVIANINNSTKTAEEAKNELTKSLINVDTDDSGKADYNIDIDGNGTADVNKDTNGDGTPDTNKTQTTDPMGNNYDIDGDRYPDTNVDIDGDGKPDLDIDVDGDKKPDVNIDIDGDKKPDINIDIDGDKKPDINIDIDGDKKPDINIDIDGDKKPDINIDIDGDKKPDINIDIDGDKKPDINIDIDGDKKPDINIDIDGDKKPDINIDIDGDKKPDINIDIDGDKKPDINIDIDGDKKPDVNVDIDGDRKPDLNIDTDGDGKPDKNIDANGNGILDSLEGNGENALPTTGVDTVSTVATLLGLSGLLLVRRNKSNI